MNETEQAVVEVAVSGTAAEDPGVGEPQADQPDAGNTEGGSRAQERIRQLALERNEAKALAEEARQEARKANERLERLLEQALAPKAPAEPDPDPEDEGAVLRAGIAKTSRRQQQMEQELAQFKFERSRDQAVGAALANVSGLNQRAAERLKAHLAATFASDPKTDLRREAAAYLGDLGLLTKPKAAAGQAAPAAPGTPGYVAEKKADAAKVAAPKSAALAIPPASAVERQPQTGPYDPRKQQASLLAEMKAGALAMVRAREGQ